MSGKNRGPGSYVSIHNIVQHCQNFMSSINVDFSQFFHLVALGPWQRNFCSAELLAKVHFLRFKSPGDEDVFPCSGPFLNHSCLNLSGCTESTFQMVRIPLYFLIEKNFPPIFKNCPGWHAWKIFSSKILKPNIGFWTYPNSSTHRTIDFFGNFFIDLYS